MASSATPPVAEQDRRAAPHASFAAAVETSIMPVIVSLGLGIYWQRYQDLLAAERLSADELMARQWRRWRSAFAHAAEHVPFYRQRLAAAGLAVPDLETVDDLHLLAAIDKRDIVGAFPDRICAHDTDRADWRYRSTSGTALRLMAVTDHAARQWRYALHLRSLTVAGDWRVGQRQVFLRTRACSEVCSARAVEEHRAAGVRLPIESEWPPYGFARLTLQETELAPLEMRGGRASTADLDDHLRRLAEVEPYLLRGLPDYLLALARRLRETSAPAPPVSRIVVQDSLAPAGVKREIAAAFACEVRETYGSSELGSVAAECEQGYLHIASDGFLVEALCADGSAAAAGDIGALVISALTNRAMPLLRYRLGDLGRLVAGSCACGRNTPRVIVEGREREALPLARGGWLTGRAVADALAGFSAIARFQLVERPAGRLDVHVVAAAEPLAGAAVTRAVQDLVGDSFQVRVRRQRAISPEPSGKFALIKAVPRDHHPREVRARCL